MWRTTVSVGVAVLMAGAMTSTTSAAPAAQAPEPAPGFYEPPQKLPPGEDGDVVRSEPSPIAFALPGNQGQLPANATRMMYRSRDTHGKPTAVTGTYFDPTTPWNGPGPRPLISLAPGTQGQGDGCAPSKLVNTPFTVEQPGGPMIEYEMLQVHALLAKGYAVVMTDYEGLGTPGTHTYVNRASEGHAVLDAARAAQNLRDTQLPPNPRVGLWGYSQGGGAAAAAAELAEPYAPELDIRGTYSGAPPADLRATLKQADGGTLAGVLGYTLNSMSAAYPELRPRVEENVNEEGKKMLEATSQQCVGATALQFAFHRTDEYTADGRPLDEVLNDIPESGPVLEDNKIGNRKPNAPALVVSGSADDVVPHGQAKQLAADWRAQGAEVDWHAVPEPPIASLRTGVTHLVGEVPGLLDALNWMDQRFQEQPGASAGEHSS